MKKLKTEIEELEKFYNTNLNNSSMLMGEMVGIERRIVFLREKLAQQEALENTVYGIPKNEKK